MPPRDLAERGVTATHLVKGEDLNHYRTLYGGRCVEWCVHLAYVTAQNCFDEHRPLVFMSVRNLSVRAPVRFGEIIQLTGRVDYLGDSAIGIQVEGHKLQPKDQRQTVVTGTFLFCATDESGKAVPHGLPDLVPESTQAGSRWKKDAQDATAAYS